LSGFGAGFSATAATAFVATATVFGGATVTFAAFPTIRWGFLDSSLGRRWDSRRNGERCGRGCGRHDRDIGVAGRQDEDRENRHHAKADVVAHAVSESSGRYLHRASPILAIDLKRRR